MLSPTMLWASTEAVAQLGYREVWVSRPAAAAALGASDAPRSPQYTPFQDKDFDAERLVSMVGQAENGVKPRAAPGAVDGQDPLPCGANKVLAWLPFVTLQNMAECVAKGGIKRARQLCGAGAVGEF